MNKRLGAAPLLAVLVVLMGQLAVFGEKFWQVLPDKPARNQQIMQGLMKIITMPPDIQTAQAGNKVDMSVTSTRGGNGDSKPLGLYGIGQDVQFRSGYKDLDPQAMANWAYDLHQFILSQGGGWENYLRYKRQPSPDSLGRSMVSYAKEREFAKDYWDHWGGDKFRHMGEVWRSWWMNDAILDGNHVYLEYQQRLGGYGSADMVMYKDAVLAELLKRD